MNLLKLFVLCSASLLMTLKTAPAKSNGNIIMTCNHEYGRYKFYIDTNKKRLFGQVEDPEPWASGKAWTEIEDWSTHNSWFAGSPDDYEISLKFRQDGKISYTWAPQDNNYNYWIDYFIIDPINGTLSIRHTASPKRSGVHFWDIEETMPMKSNQTIDETYRAQCDVTTSPFRREPKSY